MNQERQAAARLLITAVGEGRITTKLALAYLDADLSTATLTTILQAHDLPQKAAPSLPAGLSIRGPSPFPMPKYGGWELTCLPGQPISTATLQQLYPTTNRPAPFRPLKPWPASPTNAATSASR